jgi:hypothetical protein
MHSIDFKGHGTFTRDWLDQHPEEAQGLLAQFKGEYPRCLCKPEGLPLYIAQRSKYYLARLPNTGPQHAPSCPSYEPDAALCGSSLYSHTALQQHADGRVHVKLGVPLVIRGGRPGMNLTSPPSGAVQRELRDTMTLKGLLHLLFDLAEFNRWRPAMRNRRRYRQLYKYLMETADRISVRREALTRHLFMPEPFNPEQAMDIEARRQRALRERSLSGGGTPLRILVLGQVRSINPPGHPKGGVALAQAPKDFVIRASPELLGRLRVANEFAWIDWPVLIPELRLMVLLTMQRSREGTWIADDIASLVTTGEYIPVASMEEALLTRRLIDERRLFVKPLPYDGPRARYPNFLLTDCGEIPVPLEILGRADPDSATQHVRLAQYREDMRPYWRWDVEEAPMIPALPPQEGIWASSVVELTAVESPQDHAHTE